MENQEIIDVPQFRHHLKEIAEMLKESIRQDGRAAEEFRDILGSVNRLEKQLGDKDAQQLITDFVMVTTFIGSIEDMEDDEEFLDEDEYEEDEEDRD